MAFWYALTHDCGSECSSPARSHSLKWAGFLLPLFFPSLFSFTNIKLTEPESTHLLPIQSNICAVSFDPTQAEERRTHSKIIYEDKVGRIFAPKDLCGMLGAIRISTG